MFFKLYGEERSLRSSPLKLRDNDLKNYLNPNMTDKLQELSALSLAHIGDAVFELMVRTHLCMDGTRLVDKLHKRSVEYVSAKSQASAADALLQVLCDEEKEVFKRGRNSHTGQIPKNSTREQYHAATGLEALFGYLYLSGNIKRLNELFEVVIRKD